jgi:hypothetical protein
MVEGQMKLITATPYTLAVRPATRGWEVVCPPGPLADLLACMAEDLGAGNGNGPRQEQIGDHRFQVIPLTDRLDRALVDLVDALIDLRYETNRVQLELFSLEELP